jgi:hypothetical protein
MMRDLAPQRCGLYHALQRANLARRRHRRCRKRNIATAFDRRTHALSRLRLEE